MLSEGEAVAGKSEHCDYTPGSLPVIVNKSDSQNFLSLSLQNCNIEIR
jgi:hypothetical protein